MCKYANAAMCKFPRYTFDVKNVFICCAIAVSALFSSCKKKVDNSYPKNYTAKMGGMRTWRGTYNWGFNGPGPVGDTLSFAISVISPSTISAQNVLLYYRSYNDADKSMFFVGPSPVTSQDSSAVTYYFLADSIVYYMYSRPTLCCYEEYNLTAK